MTQPYSNLSLQNVRIIFPNFSGKESLYNPAGNRNFIVLLPDSLATNVMFNDWNIKTINNEFGIKSWLPVYINQLDIDPLAVIFRNGKTVRIKTYEKLDQLGLSSVDLEIFGVDWTVAGKSGRKAYMKSIVVN